MPYTPKQEATFLAFPKATEQVFSFQRTAAVLPRIFIFKKVIADYVKENSKNKEDRNDFSNKK